MEDAPEEKEQEVVTTNGALIFSTTGMLEIWSLCQYP
jgi:hypothetical protein